MDCIFCVPPTSPYIVPLTLDDLCEPHRTEEVEALRDMEAAHPQGLDVHDGCGCVDAETFFREMRGET